MFLSRHFTQDFSLMGEKEKIVSPHMIKILSAERYRIENISPKEKINKNRFSGGNFC